MVKETITVHVSKLVEIPDPINFVETVYDTVWQYTRQFDNIHVANSYMCRIANRYKNLSVSYKRSFYDAITGEQLPF